MNKANNYFKNSRQSSPEPDEFRVAENLFLPGSGQFGSERIRYLNEIISYKEKALAAAPPGFLKIQIKGGHPYYFQVIRGKTPCCRYLAKDKMDLVRRLAQKSYDRKVLDAACAEQKALEAFQNSFPQVPMEKLFEKLPKARKSLVTPIFLPDDQYLSQWIETPFTPKGFPEDYPEYYTENDERVRSKSEILIANLLKKKGIPYKYECPLKLANGHTIHPDFTLLQIRNRRTLYLEHLGRMDDASYSEAAIDRISLYEENGIFPGDRLILTHETTRRPLNIKHVEKILDFYI